VRARFVREFAYSFLFGGAFGYLDYAMSSGTLTPQITGATEWHINAEEPDVFDYDTSFKSDYQDTLFDPTPHSGRPITMPHWWAYRSTAESVSAQALIESGRRIISWSTSNCSP
jgi:hypothetical protein